MRQRARALNLLIKSQFSKECGDQGDQKDTALERNSFIGRLEEQGVTITMWGTHRLTARDGPYSYLVKAADDTVLAALEKHENQKVKIGGLMEYYNLEGGFWGLTAYVVEPLPPSPPSPPISPVPK